MQLQVIRNLELSIQNIHIVYEDRSTKPDHPFSFGITLNYIKLHVKSTLINVKILQENMNSFVFFIDNHATMGTNYSQRRYTVNS